MKQTKPTPKAKLAHVAAPTTTTPEAKPQAVPQPTPPAELNDFQQLLCMLCADAIAHGGRRQDINLFLQGLLAHQQFLNEDEHSEAYYKYARTTAEEHRADWVKRSITDWQDSLTRSARPRLDSPESEFSPKMTAAERIRANNRDLLVSRFNSFLHRGTPEEVDLLSEVLETHAQCTCPPGADRFADFELANSFMETLRDSTRFIRVPWNLREIFEKQVQLTIKAKDIADAA